VETSGKTKKRQKLVLTGPRTSENFQKHYNQHFRDGSESLIHYLYPYQTSQRSHLTEYGDEIKKSKNLSKLSPKLDVLVKMLNAEPHMKTLVLCHPISGMKMLAEALEAKIDMKGRKCKFECYSTFLGEETNEKSVTKVDDDIKQFTAQKTPDAIAIANSKVFGEGVDWKQMDRLILLDVPRSTSQYVQMVGRVFRLCRRDERWKTPNSHCFKCALRR